MSGVDGITAPITAMALVAVPGAALTPAPRRRGAGWSPAYDALEPDDAAFTVIDPPTLFTSAAPRRGHHGAARPSSVPSSLPGRRSVRDRLDVLRAYVLYPATLGYYVDLWV